MPVVETVRVDGVGVVTLVKPPVNAFGAALRRELFEAIAALDAAGDIHAIVLHGRGRGFSAGGDIHEFGTPAAREWPGMSSDLHPRIEACRKPVIAAVHGLCLGGGLETALACHWRVIAADASVGLPEVRVGVLPLSGTQRLPRLIGLRPAAQYIASAEIVAARTLPALADRLVEASGEHSVIEAAMALAGSDEVRAQRELVRHRPVLGLDQLDAVRGMANAAETPIVRCALEAVLAAGETGDFDSGLDRARALYDTLILSEESVALQRSFASRNEAARD